MTSYLFKNGWTTQTDLIANGYNFATLPPQDDRNFGGMWLKPGDGSDVIHPVRLVESLNGYRKAYGGINFTWFLRNLSPKMTAYLRNLMLGSPSAYSAQVTIRTFDRSDGTWKIYQAIAQWPNILDEAETKVGGWDNLKIRFVNSSIAPEN